MTLFDAIQQLIIRYAGNEITLGMFRDLFVPLYLSVDRTADVEAVALADRVESLYADLLAGELDNNQFMRKLSSFYPMVVIASTPESAFTNVTGSKFESITGNPRSTSNDAYTIAPQYAECV